MVPGVRLCHGVEHTLDTADTGVPLFRVEWPALRRHDSVVLHCFCKQDGPCQGVETFQGVGVPHCQVAPLLLLLCTGSVVYVAMAVELGTSKKCCESYLSL